MNLDPVNLLAQLAFILFLALLFVGIRKRNKTLKQLTERTGQQAQENAQRQEKTHELLREMIQTQSQTNQLLKDLNAKFDRR